MIGYLNPPFRDEILTSLLARYKKQFGFSDAAVCTDFFGVPHLHSIVNFPSRLDYLEQQIPEAFGVTVPILVRDYTLLPFFAPFMSTGDVEEIIGAMRGKASESYLSRLSGPSAGCEHLRYCPECAKGDREAPRRETYWRRLHQIGIVKVCPIHEVFLVSSDVRTSGRAHFVSAEDAINFCDSVHRLDEHNTRDALLLWIAQQAEWLLSNGMTVAGQRPSLQQLYEQCLEREGLITQRHILKLSRFNRMVYDCVGPELLEEIDCTLEEKNKHHWARRIVKGREPYPHPIQHLLLIRCFRMNIADCFRFLPSTPTAPAQHFEPGPWPCLNPACTDSGRAVIDNHQIRIDLRGQLFGIFSCQCGYTYSRRGPDPSGQTRYAAHKVISTGKVWDDTLRKLWMRPEIPVYEIGATLHSYNYPIMQAIVRLGLPLNRPRLKTPPAVHKEEREKEKARTRKCYRDYFLGYRAKHPKKTRSQLQRSKGQIRRITEWLRIHDGDWLWEHMPKRISSRGKCALPSIRAVDWESRDDALQAKVASVRESLVSRQGRPIRISKNALLIELGFSHGLNRRHFPRTIVAIKACEESLQQCAARRVYWLLENSDSPYISLTRLKEDARIRPGWEKHPHVAEALEHAIEFQFEHNMWARRTGSARLKAA